MTNDLVAHASLSVIRPADSGSSETAADRARDEFNDSLRGLIVKAAQGDAKSFERLYDLTVRPILARVRRIAGEVHAEDILADVYLQVWRSLASYQSVRGEPLGWLMTIARSRALDRLRTERRLHGGGSGAVEFDFGAEPSGEPGPDELVSRLQHCSLLNASMAKLSPNERTVLGLAYYRDCSHNEIASLMGLPLGTVKTLISRSQLKLRKAFTQRVTVAGISATAQLPEEAGAAA